MQDMDALASRWYQQFRSMAGRIGGYAAAGSSSARLLHPESEEYKRLMDRSHDEVDVLAIPGMLNVPAPMSWADYCRAFIDAVEGDQFYPNLHQRYRELTKAFAEKQITHEQFSSEPVVYAVKGTSKFLAKILRFKAVEWLPRRERERNKPGTAS